MQTDRQIVVSLPIKRGKLMKNYLQRIADEDHRSLSNQVSMIIEKWVTDNAEFGWDIEHEQDKRQSGATEKSTQANEEGSDREIRGVTEERRESNGSLPNNSEQSDNVATE